MTKPGEFIPTTTFKTRFRTLFAMELLGYRRQGYFWGLLAAIAMSWASPALAVAVAGTAMGFIAFSFCEPEQSDPVFADFLLTRAVRRREVFAAKAVLSAAVGLAVVTCALVWKDWLPCVDHEFQVENASLAFPYFYLLFMLCWSLCAFAMVTFGATSLTIGIAFVPLVLLGGLFGALWIGTCDTDRVSAMAITLYVCVGSFAVGLFIAALSAFLGMESGPPEEDRTEDDWPLVHLTGPAPITPTTTGEKRATVTSHKARPDEVLYFRSLMRVEFRHLTTVPQTGLALLYLVLGALMESARLSFVMVFAVLLQSATLTNLSVRELLFTLPVSRRLHFRTKTAVGFLILVPILIVFTLWGSLWTGRSVTVPLTHRAAEAVNARVSSEESHWYRPSPRFPGEPKETYDYYTVPDGRLAYALARSSIVIAWYALSWMGMLGMSTRSLMRQIAKRKNPPPIWISPIGTILIIAVWMGFSYRGGPLMAWTFVIAYKYPVHIIAATVAICALLLRLPERRFANLEVAP